MTLLEKIRHIHKRMHMKSNHGNDATINTIEIIQWQLFLFEGVYPIIDS